MVSKAAKDRDRAKKERIKSAVESAMAGQWKEAAQINRALLEEYPDELGSYNRLGKALGELGLNKQARKAFQRALKLSPHNAIAKKNLERLVRLGDENSVMPEGNGVGGSNQHAFIEESGKAAVTALTKLCPTQVLLKLSPGRSLKLTPSRKALKVTTTDEEYIGEVEPRVGSRLLRLIEGGNKYNTAVTGVDEHGIHIIIREEYKHPSQAKIVSFPGRIIDESNLKAPSKAPNVDLGFMYEDQNQRQQRTVNVKDWSNDDTEPGDDDVFNPVVHRIINSTNDTSEEIDAAF